MYNPEIFRDLQDTIRDNNDGVNDASFADSVAFLLRILMQESGVTLPADAKYLAIGAGQAKAEIALAIKLGIEPVNVTLLDKNFSPHARKRFQAIGFSGGLEEEDLFQYFQTSRPERFDIASAFGMEYVFTDIGRTEQLIAGLSTVLSPNGIALLAPYDIHATDATPIWNQYGFVSLDPHKDERPFSYQMILHNPFQR